MPLEHAHSEEAIRRRLSVPPTLSYVRDWIYGGIDGCVTTFAIVAGATGAELSSRVVILMGVANLIADGFSMAASNYSGTKADLDEFRRLREVERRHIAEAPEGERAEIREIYRMKGFSGPDLERVVDVLTSDRATWIRTMLAEEYGLPAVQRSPTKAAASTFAAFLTCGLVPLLPFLVGGTRPFAVATVLTGLVFAAIGSAKSRWSPMPWWRSAAETYVIGMAAALLAFIIGAGLDRIL